MTLTELRYAAEACTGNVCAACFERAEYRSRFEDALLCDCAVTNEFLASCTAPEFVAAMPMFPSLLHKFKSKPLFETIRKQYLMHFKTHEHSEEYRNTILPLEHRLAK